MERRSKTKWLVENWAWLVDVMVDVAVIWEFVEDYWETFSVPIELQHFWRFPIELQDWFYWSFTMLGWLNWQRKRLRHWPFWLFWTFLNAKTSQMKDFCSYQKLLFFNAVTQLELKFKFICLCAKKSKCNKILQESFLLHTGDKFKNYFR